MGVGGALGAIISIRNNNNMRSKRVHFSKENRIRRSKKDKPIYNSITELDLKRLRKKLTVEQNNLKRKKNIAILIIGVFTTIAVGLILFYKA